jgi:hypothetical protein
MNGTDSFISTRGYSMKKYTVNTDVTMSLCDEFYDTSALTLEGLDLDSLDDYANYLDRECGLKDGAVFHVIDGNEMDDFYMLSGKNAYPGDLHIVVIKLSDLINPNKIIMKRFEFGGRWFDDVVDNNARRAS